MQKLVQEKNAIQQAAALIKEAGFHDVFLITGKHFQLHNDYSFLEGIKITDYLKEGVNVEEKEIGNAYKAYSNSKVHAILAIGGGSVIDLAKALIWKIIQDSKPIPFFMAAPTTAGSGTEATHFAVVYQGKKKRSLVNQTLLPQAVLLDPILTYTLSPYQTAVSGFDVFAQAVEAYWNKNATGESKIFAIQAISIWKEHFIKAVTAPDELSREKMQYAAYLAGKAINITRTTGPHALSYYLTANNGVPHGQAVGLLLPVFFLYNTEQEELYHLLAVENKTEAYQYIVDMMSQAGLATKLSELDIDKNEIIDQLLDEVNEERFANNPTSFDKEKLKQLIIEHL